MSQSMYKSVNYKHVAGGEGVGSVHESDYRNGHEVYHKEINLHSGPHGHVRAIESPGGIGVLTRHNVPKFLTLINAAIAVKGTAVNQDERFALAEMYPMFRELSNVLGYPEEIVAANVVNALFGKVGSGSQDALDALIAKALEMKARKSGAMV